MDNNEKAKPMGQVIQIDEARIRDYLGELVRGTVEETLNAMLDAELCGAGRYECTEGRNDTRAGELLSLFVHLGHWPITGFPDSRWIKLKNQQSPGADYA